MRRATLALALLPVLSAAAAAAEVGFSKRPEVVRGGDRFSIRFTLHGPTHVEVAVLDASGNTITRFGSYGNMDSRGPGSPVPEPAIPLGWPLSVECAGGRAFIADLVNRRIVAVRFEHATAGECAVP